VITALESGHQHATWTHAVLWQYLDSNTADTSASYLLAITPGELQPGPIQHSLTRSTVFDSSIDSSSFRFRFSRFVPYICLQASKYSHWVWH
jgi:hypothetical protein